MVGIVCKTLDGDVDYEGSVHEGTRQSKERKISRETRDSLMVEKGWIT